MMLGNSICDRNKVTPSPGASDTSPGETNTGETDSEAEKLIALQELR